MLVTYHSIHHIERLTRSLHDIFTTEMGRPVSLETCCAAVSRGLTLSGEASHAPMTYIGLPWCTTPALLYLAGLGHVFEPRLVLQALQRLERRHIIDTRRGAYSPLRSPRSLRAKCKVREQRSAKRKHAA